MFKNSRIFVAGHTGLLGTALLAKLKEKGAAKIITRKHSELDLTDRGHVERFFREEKPEIVFLAAGKTGGIAASSAYPATFFHENAAMQINVIEAAQKYGVRHFVFYGSSCMYPRNSPQPIKEEYLMTGPLDEFSEAYAGAKISGVLACRAYNSQYRTNRFIAVVPNTLYGPNDHFSIENSHVFSALLRRFHEAKVLDKQEVALWGSGNPRREFIFSEDVADASIFLVENAGKLDNTHYNAGTGVDYSIRELAGIIARKIGYGGEIRWDATRPDGVSRKLLDSSRIEQLGWKPSVTIEEGLERTYKWYLENVEGAGR
ncbi:MAG: GDP-L-fucose synthase [Deltaproteobacteria bacterium]|nr:GDP-L-fucose synthase [Deltaproteobacteria bacterium]